MKLFVFAILLLFALLFGTAVWLMSRKRLRASLARGCLGRQWKTKFPEATNDEIRGFLETFTDAFCINGKKKLNFGPDDKLMDVYRALNPVKGMADAMEIETFAIRLEENYRLDLIPVWQPDITLGQVFAMTRK